MFIRQSINVILFFLLFSGNILLSQGENIDSINITSSGSRSFISLNGEWFTHRHKGLKFHYPPPEDGWEKQVVPHMSAKFIKTTYLPSSHYLEKMQKNESINFENMENISAWYKKTFKLPEKNKLNGIAYLRFESMPFKSEVWLNGIKLGENVVSLVPKRYPVTKILRFGKENELVIGLAGIEGLIDLKNKTFIAPFANAHAGITGDVILEFVPEIFIDDIFITTSVKNKTIDIECTLCNLSKRSRTVIPQCVIKDYQSNIPQTEIKGDAVKLAAGATKTIHLIKNWVAPVLWTPETPKLYIAECFLFSSTHNKLIDSKLQRFGFRKFTIIGRHFYLNGKPITLFRKCIASPLGRGYKELYDYFDLRKRGRREFMRPYNNFRVWGYNPLCADMADEMGATLSWTLTTFQPRWFPIEKKKFWLPNLLKHNEKLIKLLRNNPSIVIWNMTNETYWGKVPDNPEMKSICTEIVKAIRKIDHTRPLDGDAEVGWDGLLDIISIHYPGLAGSLHREYRNSCPIIPNDMYWLKDKGENYSWRAKFIWDKPLSLGEYWNLAGDVNSWINMAGEDIFDWVKYSTQDKRGRDGRPDNPFVNTLKMITDYYRLKGVACLNPWYMGVGEDILPPVAVRPIDFHPNFYGGGFLNRNLALFNDSSKNYWNSHLQYFLRTGNRQIAEGKINIPLKSGDKKRYNLKFPLPYVKKPTRATLTVRLCYYAGGSRHEINRYEETIYIMPKVNLKDLNNGKIILFDPQGNTTEVFKKLGLKLSPLKSLAKNDLTSKKLIIIAPDVDVKTEKEKLLSFVKNGGSILFLEQKPGIPLDSQFPEIDENHITSRCWKRYYNHPVTAGLENPQFSYWFPDNIVAKYSMIKPFSSNVNIILDAPGVQGLAWTPLCELGFGNGVFLFSQMDLIKKSGKEPMADFLLYRLIKYALNFQSPQGKPLRLLTNGNSQLEKILSAASIDYSLGLNGNGPIFIDKNINLTDLQIQKIKSFAENGGKVWIRLTTPERLKQLKPILPYMPKLKPIPKNVFSAVRKSDSSLMNNLSSEDFFWVKLNLGERMDYFGNSSKPTAPLGKYEIEFPGLEQAEPLLDPKLLTDCPLGKGHLLLDSFEWEKSFISEGTKVIRIINALARNLGAKVKIKKEVVWNYSYVDISKFANMGYVDEIPDDGKGGWLDMGKSDLCFFLTNHTGLANGVGAPVAVKPFPQEYRFLGIPFKLVDPKMNNNKAIISLRGKTHSVKLPDKVIGIPVGKKAKRLWFLHAAGYVPHKKGITIAKYVINYTDVSNAIFPLRSGIEIGDWCPPQRLQSAKIAWIGYNRVLPQVGVYLTSWENPYPKKTIKSIDIIGALADSSLAVLGITIGNFANSDNKFKVIANWDFRKPKDGIVRDTVSGIPLTPREDNPDKHKFHFGKDGVNLHGKQYFTGNMNNLKDFDPTNDFEIKAKFSISTPPQRGKGSYGLFQAMEYMHSGFRIFIDSNKRILVEIFPSPGKSLYLRSNVILMLNQIYTLQVRFEKETTSIFINGKLDSMISSPLPAPYKKGLFMIGHASGSGYFEGTITNISILNL